MDVSAASKPEKQVFRRETVKRYIHTVKQVENFHTELRDILPVFFRKTWKDIDSLVKGETNIFFPILIECMYVPMMASTLPVDSSLLLLVSSSSSIPDV